MELETTTKVPVERLRLDRRNPRLLGQAEDASDESIIARLYRSAELDELLQSISANGYLDIEPLVVMRASEDGALIVLEGNRRLATLRLLLEPALVGRIAASEDTRIAVPEIDDEVRSTLDQVSVYLVENREHARAFIGCTSTARPSGTLTPRPVSQRNGTGRGDLKGWTSSRSRLPSATGTIRSSGWCRQSACWSRRKKRGCSR